MKKIREALEAINCIDTRGLKRLLCELVEADIFDGGLINKTISAVERARHSLSDTEMDQEFLKSPTKTLAGIAAELRKLSESVKRASVENFKYQPTMYGKPIALYFAEFADRIEETAKRAYNEIDHAVCAIEEAFSYDIDNVREAMNGTIGDYYE